MEWMEVSPEQDDWDKQFNVVAYYGSHILGSIVHCEDGWMHMINGSMDFIDAETEEQAKEEMIDILESHFEGEINYYEELISTLDDLRN